MDPAHLPRLGELLEQALALSHTDRSAWLAQARAQDSEQARHLSELLADHDAAETWFNGLAADLAAEADLEVEAATTRHVRVGPWRLLGLLGRGGMGAVYLAERADGQFEQQAALKLARAGFDDSLAIKRFMAERQIVAGLEHPHIARLIDGGVTDDGRPYFAMERVEGRTLVEECDRRRLSVDARLTLFLQLADAVQYAHRHLIVHRDLKPSNVLVTEDGVVKLLDFGIAKLFDPSAGLVTDDGTMTRDRVMTPSYAAPEQIAGGAITTATDIYALGVLLYELVCGRRPFEQGDRTARALEEDVLLKEPERPSAVIAAMAPTEAGPIAEARVSTRDRLRRRLRGDLDVICLTALRKEPGRRYRSAEQMVDDIRRHLARLPIAAQTDTFRYRAGKFVRRHAVGVVTTTAAILLLVVAAGALAIQSAVAARERDKAQQVADLLVRLFEVADPSEARGTTITAREVLDRGVERIQSELGTQAELKAALLAVMGRVYQNLGLYGRAAPLVEQSLALRRQTLGPSHRDVAEGLNALGEVLRLRGDYAAAEPVLRDALTLNQQVNGDDAPETARTRNNLSKLLYARGRSDEAETFARQALATTRARLGAEHVEVGESLMNLGAALFAKGNDKDAEPLFREALAIRRKALGSDHPLVPAALNNLAALLSRKGDFAAAEAAHREALDIYRHVFGAEHPRVATSLNNLALVLFARSDHAAAEPLFRESLAMRRKLLDPSHTETAQSLANLGLLLQTTGRFEEAEPLYREALAIRRTALGDKHPLVAQTLNNLGLLLQARGELDAAEPLFRQSLDVLRGQLGAVHPLVATNLHNLAALVRAKGDGQGAEPLYREALDIRRKALPAGHPETALTLVGWGTLLSERGNAAGAEPLLREALGIREKALQPANPAVAEARSALGLCLLALNRPGEAEPLLVASLETLRAQPNASAEMRVKTAETLRAVVRVYTRLGDDEKAKAYQALVAAEHPTSNPGR